MCVCDVGGESQGGGGVSWVGPSVASGWWFNPFLGVLLPNVVSTRFAVHIYLFGKIPLLINHTYARHISTPTRCGRSVCMKSKYHIWSTGSVVL